MDLRHRFPDELWLEVLACLPPYGLRSLSSTSRAFHDLARPYGFTEFKLYPYPYDREPTESHLAEALERVSFWSSPKIAPHVRSCTIEGGRQPSVRLTVKNLTTKSPHILIDTFFERLPRFIGLQQLAAHNIRFTQMGVENGLPALTRVELRIYTPRFADSPRGDLHYRRRQYEESLAFSAVSDTLQELHFPDLIPLANPGVLPFPSVHTLTVHSLPKGKLVAIVLTKFPRVCVFSTNSVLEGLTPSEELTILPFLKEYTGSPQNLHIFVQRVCLTHITFSTACFFHMFLAELEGVTMLPNIVALTASFRTSSGNGFGKAEIETLFALFPKGLNPRNFQKKKVADSNQPRNNDVILFPYMVTHHPKRVRISSSNHSSAKLGEVKVRLRGRFTDRFSNRFRRRFLTENRRFSRIDTASFLESLATSAFLPVSLEILSLDWAFSDGNNCPAPNLAEIPDFELWRDYIFIDGYHFLFWWLKMFSVWEATAWSYDDAQILRE
ncbi:hypothetical protein K438DRAFT_1946417 [Mycena galopus ATCC 62051]|nr:hypothetical protein K438DRAFT_1946417 [Mycena galopus ATCC 62051]